MSDIRSGEEIRYWLREVEKVSDKEYLRRSPKRLSTRQHVIAVLRWVLCE